MANTEDKLKSVLYRAFCPESSVLGEYHLGILPEEQAAAIHSHLQDCLHCTRELEQLRIFLGEIHRDLEVSPIERAADSLMEGVRSLVARLVESSRGGKLSPTIQGIRGEEERVYTYEADGYQVILDIQADHERQDRRVIYGLVLGPKIDQFGARLAIGGELIATAPVDEFGNFEFASIAPGQVELIFHGPEIEIRVEDLLLE